MITTDPLERLRAYKQYYRTDKYPNILLSKDYKYEFYNYFKPKTTPYLAIYNRRKELTIVYAGFAQIDNPKIINYLEE
jgi:hypothetical protein